MKKKPQHIELRGRPALPDTVKRNYIFSMRITRHEFNYIKELAKDMGVSQIDLLMHGVYLAEAKHRKAKTNP